MNSQSISCNDDLHPHGVRRSTKEQLWKEAKIICELYVSYTYTLFYYMSIIDEENHRDSFTMNEVNL